MRLRILDSEVMMKLPPGAIVHDDGKTIYIRQDRERSAFLEYKHQSGRLGLMGLRVETITQGLAAVSSRLRFLRGQLAQIAGSMRHNLEEMEGPQGSPQRASFLELIGSLEQIGRELDSEFTEYRNHWKEEGDTTDDYRNDI